MVIAIENYPKEVSWTLGTCKSARTYWNSHSSYTESCCLAAGTYELTCDDSGGNGWNGGQVQIGDAKYCDDFRIGLQETHVVDISGK